MANMLQNNRSELKNQRTLKAFQREVGAAKLFINTVTNRDGEPVLNSYGHEAICFLLTDAEGTIIERGLVADATAQEGIDPKRAQVAESHYINKAGEPAVCLMLFNGINMLEGATEIQL